MTFPSPITTIDIKTGSSKAISVILTDQDGNSIQPAATNFVIADNTIVGVRTTIENWFQVVLTGLKAGSTTVTFSGKGVNKVLTVNVVDPVPTNIDIYEGAYEPSF